MDYPRVYTERSVKRTRKEHKCCECRRPIPVGSGCRKADGIWDHGAKTFYWCLACDLLMQEASQLLDNQDDPIGFGELHEFINEVSRWP